MRRKFSRLRATSKAPAESTVQLMIADLRADARRANDVHSERVTIQLFVKVKTYRITLMSDVPYFPAVLRTTSDYV